MPPRFAATEGPDPIDIAVGECIRRRRRYLGLSQTYLASRLGVTFQQVQKYERGANRVSASTLVRTAEVLGTTVSELVGEGTTAEPVVDGRLLTPEARKLLAAYAAIPKGETRAALVAIAEALDVEGDKTARGG